VSATPEKESDIFKKYLATRKVLIADPSATSRSGLFRVFQDCGSPPNSVILVNSYGQAKETIKNIKPHIVITEFDIDRRSGSGLDLLIEQRQQQPKETKECLFVIATNNTSQSAVARAAEEDVDAFIIKPFTVETVRKTLVKAALLKLKPPEYLLLVEKGKEALIAQNYDEAEKLLEQAVPLDPAPSLALYYIGMTKFARQITEEAEGKYNKGLDFNKIHYKCLVGLYELMGSQKRHHEAYEVVKRVSQYFPANPKRLSEVLRLAIITQQYDDVEKYYQAFCNIDERDDTLVKYVCAALVVCGKYYLGTGARSRAMTLFQKASATGTGRANIIKEIVQALVEANLPKDARDYQKKFPPEFQTSKDYQLLNFEITNLEGPVSAVIQIGRELQKQNIHSERFYEIMIGRSQESSLKDAVEALAYEAAKNYPDKKDHFMALAKIS